MLRLINNPMKNKAGFSLIELLVVMVILGLLAALVGPKLFPKVAKGRQAAARAQIELLGQALDQYRLDTNHYPSTQESLEALKTSPGTNGWDGPYLRKALPKDPWGRSYIYKSPGSYGDYDLYTYGLDGAAGGEKENKDLNSWE